MSEIPTRGEVAAAAAGRPSGRYRLELAKEGFKFSAAHFTLFGATEAEPLHGHNYRVGVEVEGEGLDELGLLVPAGPLKAAVRAACAGLDDRVLLPGMSPLVAIQRAAGAVRARFGSREYAFPEGEVLVLPLVNTTIELFARHLWNELARQPVLADRPHLGLLAVTVEETEGQRCRYAAPLAGARA